MSSKERIYDAFGELVYLVAMADGIIQEEEISALEKILESHPHAKEIKWSFDYERSKHNDIEDLYKKVIIRCRENGPDPEYAFLIQMLKAVAEASSGIDSDEKETIDHFVSDLLERFKKDINDINDLKS